MFKICFLSKCYVIKKMLASISYSVNLVGILMFQNHLSNLGTRLVFFIRDASSTGNFLGEDYLNQQWLIGTHIIY